MVFVGEPVLEAIAGMVEDHRALFSRRHPQRPAAHLQIQPERLGRAQQQHPGEGRHVEAFGEQAHIEHDLDLAGCEPGDRRGAGLGRGAGIDVPRADTGLCEGRGQLPAVGDRAGIADRRPPPARAPHVAPIVVDGVADQLGPAHRFGRRLGLEIAADRPDVAEVEARGRRVAHDRGQIAAGDQAGRRRCDDHVLKDPAEAFAVEPDRRCAKADEIGAAEGFDEPLPRAGQEVMTLVDQHQVRRPLRPAGEPRRPGQGRDHRDLTGQRRGFGETGGDDPGGNPGLGQRRLRLVDELAPVDADQDFFALARRPGRHRGNDDAFAAAGRRAVDDAPVPRQGRAQRRRRQLLGMDVARLSSSRPRAAGRGHNRTRPRGSIALPRRN